MKKTITGKSIFNIFTIVFVALANVSVLLTIIFSLQYSNMAVTAFASVYAILVCFLIILDIIFYVAIMHKVKSLTIISFVISLLLVLVGGVGSYSLSKVNKSVSNIVENTGTEQYETLYGVVSVYDNDEVDELSDLEGLKVGIVKSNGSDVNSVAKDKIEAEGIKVEYIEFESMNELFVHFLSRDVDAAVLQSTYQLLYAEEDGFKDYLDDCKDIFKFEAKIVTGQSNSSKIDTSADPFTILLIGFAPNETGGGLSDTIMLASVNPKTLNVSLTSIPRDSYTKISCTGGMAKINAARGQSRQCLVDTVSDFMDVDVDFYAEINFQGIVDIVDALGGVYIDSPIEFTGQSATQQRGVYNVWVPKGPYKANGEQALAFARERHQMPRGDVDRQIHQQEVIEEIMKSLINTRDINKALKVVEAAGDNFTTNLSLNQITSLFNYFMNINNNTGITTFNLIDIKNMRITGYSNWYYSYSMRLPQWIWSVYEGSMKENVAVIDDVLGEYKASDINQEYKFDFWQMFPWQRDVLYHETFDEAQVEYEMPAYYPYLTTMTYSEVVSWANKNGVTLDVTMISENDPNYVASRQGKVIKQWPLYGELVSDYPRASITVMGFVSAEEIKTVPNFVGKKASEVEAWAKENKYTVVTNEVENTDCKLSGLVKAQNIPEGTNVTKNTSITIDVYKKVACPVTPVDLVSFNESAKGKDKDTVKTLLVALGVPEANITVVEEESTTIGVGKVIKVTSTSTSPSVESKFAIYIAKASSSSEGESTPPSTEGGQTTPPASGGETNPPSTEGGQTTPPASGGETNPPSTEGGQTTPPATEGGGETNPPAESTGNDAQPSGGDTPPATEGGGE